MFQEAGVPVFDADAEVHRLQGQGGALVGTIEAAFPGTTSAAGVDRQALGARVLGDADALGRLEAIVHPAVAERRRAFLEQHAHERLIVLDIPLLYEKGGPTDMDAVAVVSAPSGVQRERVLARPGMTAEKFERILALQTPDAEKRARADFVIPTGGDFETTRAAVRAIISGLSSTADS